MVLGSPTSKDPVFSSGKNALSYAAGIYLLTTNLPIETGPRASELLLVLGALTLTGSNLLGFKCALTLWRSSLSS